MSAPLDLDAIRARAYGGRWARDVPALLAEVERLRADSVPRSALVQVGVYGWNGEPCYVIREAP